MLFGWEDGVRGSLRVAPSGTALSSAKDILEFARSTGASLNDRELRLLGTAIFFISLRDVGRFAAAERQLDALDPVLPDPGPNASFQNGIADLKIRLFPRRSEHRNLLVELAFAVLLSRLDELRG